MRLMEAQMDEFKDAHSMKRIESGQATSWLEVVEITSFIRCVAKQECSEFQFGMFLNWPSAIKLDSCKACDVLF